MKVKLVDIINADTRVGALTKREVPAATAFKLRKAAKAMSEEVKTYFETREEKLKAAADKDEDGEPKTETVMDGEKEVGKKYVINDEALAELDKELKDLLDQEVEIPGEPLTAEDFGEAKIAANEIPDFLIAD